MDVESMDLNQLDTLLYGGGPEQPETKPVETKPVETKEPESPEPENKEPEQKPVEDKLPEHVPYRRFQQKVHESNAKDLRIKELEAQLSGLKPKEAPVQAPVQESAPEGEPEPPDINDFDDLKSYNKAMATYYKELARAEADAIINKNTAQTQEQAYVENVQQQFVSTLQEEFETVAEDVRPVIQESMQTLATYQQHISREVQMALLECQNPGMVAASIVNDENGINLLVKNPKVALREIAKLDGYFSATRGQRKAPEQEAPTQTPQPRNAPPKPVRAGGNVNPQKTPESMSLMELDNLLYGGK